MNKLNRFLLIFLLLLGATTSSFAQFKFSSDPAQFVADVNQMFTYSKYAPGMAAGNAFASVWSSFTPEQQKNIIEVSQKMSKSKKLRVNPQFTDFFSILASMKNRGFDNANIDTLLYCSGKVIDEYTGTQMQVFFSTIRLLIEENFLFKSSYSRLRVTSGNFRLRYIEAGPAPGELGDEYLNPEESNPDSIITQPDDAFSDWDNYSEDQWTETWDESTIEPEEPIEAVVDVGYTPPPQPPVSGAVIYFENADFTFVTPYDSTTLKGTTGSVMLKSQIYVGKGGKMDWAAAGLPNVYCEMAEYNFPLKSYHFTSEGAYLSFEERTDTLVQGIFEFNSVKHKTPEDNPYPRFKSFASNIPVKGLDENIIYKGGFALGGQKIYSSSVDEGFATIEIQRDGVTRVKAISNRFQLGDSLITGQYAGIIIYQDKDSIYHPGTVFKYYKNDQYLHVTKQDGFRRAPFVDSYHKIEIVADAMNWKLDSSSIDFLITNAKCEISAEFESVNYFKAEKYAFLQGTYRFHPLQVIVNYADKNKTNVFNAGDVADAYKLQEQNVRGAMYEMMKMGYVDYNPKNGQIKVTERTRHMVRSRQNLKDYDNITFISKCPNGPNASLNLQTNELTVRGVKSMNISDSLGVTIEPDSGVVIIRKNRDFGFNGAINTANFRFIGVDFEFSYDSFLVHMPQIDSIQLAIKENKDSLNKAGKSRVLGNELRYSSGTLYLNKTWNKSAKKSFPEYPIFDATTGATVFFNKKDIGGGAYDTTMQFKIPPFKVDSLSSNSPSVIGFDGEFVSGGIFPPFKEKLVMMPDYSLGFDHVAPTEGYQMYQGKGKYYKKITLDHKGLRGDGSIVYLNTTLYSSDFMFFKDSVRTLGTNGETKIGTNPEIPQTITFPDVIFTEYILKWIPYADSMMIANSKEPFKLYNGTATMVGTQVVSEKGLLGMGVVYTRGSETVSRNYYFEEKEYSAREADFRVNSDNPDKPALKSDKVKMHFDLEAGIATFSPETKGYASNEFPYSQYKTSIDNGTWNLHDRIISMTASDTSNISNSYFYSTRTDQDSLVFNAAGAEYDMDALTLRIYGIPYIKVCDGKVFPDSNKVFIQENAVIRTLVNTRIVMDTIKEYHYLYDGTIDILGRYKFAGEAMYRYVNLGSDTLKIKFQNFKYTEAEKRKKFYTLATGNVTEEDQLFLGPKILYRGKVTMHSHHKPLIFDGYIKLDLKGEMSASSQWLKYVNSGETDQVVIDLTNAKSANGTPLVSGLHYNKQTTQIYPTFISTKVRPEDQDVLLAIGKLQYDTSSNSFSVGDSLRLSKKSYQGNYFTYDDNNSTVSFGGDMHFQTDGNTNVVVKSPGSGEGVLASEDYSFNAMLLFTYKMHASIPVAIGQNMKTFVATMPDSLEPEGSVMQRKDRLYYKLAEVMGNSGVTSYIEKSKAAYTPLADANADIAKSFVLSDVNLRWSKLYKAYYSVGKIYVSNILKDEINKWMKGYVEIRKTSKGDVVNLYLEIDENNWYFITYSENRLGVVCSSSDLNSVVEGRSKGEMADRTKFFFVKADLMEKMRFIMDFEQNYLGQEITDYTPENEPDNEPSPEEELSPEEEPSPENEPAPGDINNSNPPVTPKGKNKKGKDGEYQYSNEQDGNQYKIDGPQDPSQDQNQQSPKNANDIQQQQERYNDQQQMNDLFK